ncbi:TIGR02281 family clan AA aspartic protease [Notoacmeibacter sp. MSK16QG-6]|uniref:retropepsin-like aspartic protease family protein n=1 Tax=Notoacmeibacter sp. MSK16QG-6 TaxID=2957982 RepID=UPI0020A21C9B|nr:TIGR02281 family clan AA aspartic protease [Notoacmeibacter sp. MSK16QG-6]MCP1199495.1 TIGR02281 family clan AA aspartic protease [Notoacmeibacter sp. MSK16QG-6]
MLKWIAIGGIGVLLIIYMLESGLVESLGLPAEDGADVIYLSLWAAMLAPVILFSGMPFGRLFRSLATWVVIGLVLVVGYERRDELESFALDISAGLSPGTPVTSVSDDGRPTVTLKKGLGGHFYAQAKLDKAEIRMLVDTGATTTTLRQSDAERIGIDPRDLRFILPVMTANGPTLAARANVSRFSVGGIERRDVTIMVAKDAQLGQSLLGMNFLGSLEAFEFRRDRLVLKG